MLYFPDEQVRLVTSRSFRAEYSYFDSFGQPTGRSSHYKIDLKAGAVGTLVRRHNDDIWLVLFGGNAVRVRERHFEIPNLLERIAREVEDAECID